MECKYGREPEWHDSSGYYCIPTTQLGKPPRILNPYSLAGYNLLLYFNKEYFTLDELATGALSVCKLLVLDDIEDICCAMMSHWKSRSKGQINRWRSN